MTDVLTKKRKLETDSHTHTHTTPGMPCEDEGGDQSDARIRGETSKFASKPPEARGEARNRNCLAALKVN